ncbi:CPBP family intramembrane glutamic endopeptidase [Paucilactobacillus suebicus]|uniref:Metal-dependent membrane protease n=1 Tax=Paucilactobacillus suebicus DSM 5007 = KCTC 3549 TaxID=1423807 RepID=A0A0R1VXU5_9LACO|nr:CPBP family intramembrane glutamic endopeptidase [Paucilactobacillus suebicus]KRM10512.1 metal-dependent membrane protease [Paucilactobacillus suebicus DSM 5007 = KCTC 3549]
MQINHQSSSFREFIIKVGKFFLLTVAHNIMAVPILMAFYVLHLKATITIQITLAILCTLLGILTVYLMQKYYSRRLQLSNPMLFTTKRLTKERIWKLLITIVIIALWIFIEGFFSSSASGSADQTATANVMTAFPIPMFIVVSIIGPIYEEQLNRGIFFAYFIHSNSTLAKVMGLLSSALLFALLHGLTFDFAMLDCFLSGVVLAGIYLITKNLKYGMIAHLLSNVIASYALFF